VSNDRPASITVNHFTHDVPEWHHAVAAGVGGLVATLAVCKSPERANIVAEALRLLAATDPGFKERVIQASLDERRRGA
jgi:hypothetical protein